MPTTTTTTNTRLEVKRKRPAHAATTAPTATGTARRRVTYRRRNDRFARNAYGSLCLIDTGRWVMLPRCIRRGPDDNRFGAVRVPSHGRVKTGTVDAARRFPFVGELANIRGRRSSDFPAAFPNYTFADTPIRAPPCTPPVNYPVAEVMADGFVRFFARNARAVSRAPARPAAAKAVSGTRTCYYVIAEGFGRARTTYIFGNFRR